MVSQHERGFLNLLGRQTIPSLDLTYNLSPFNLAPFGTVPSPIPLMRPCSPLDFITYTFHEIPPS